MNLERSTSWKSSINSNLESFRIYFQLHCPTWRFLRKLCEKNSVKHYFKFSTLYTTVIDKNCLPEASYKRIRSILMCIGKSCHYKNSKLHFDFSLLNFEKIFRNCQKRIFSFSQTVESEFGSDEGLVRSWMKGGVDTIDDGWNSANGGKRSNFENPKNRRRVSTMFKKLN